MNEELLYYDVKECIEAIKSRVDKLSSKYPDIELDSLNEINTLADQIGEDWKEEIGSIEEEIMYSAEDFVVSRLMEKGLLNLSEIKCEHDEDDCEMCAISSVCLLNTSMDTIKLREEDREEASMEYTDTNTYEIIERLNHLSRRYPIIMESKITELIELVEEVDKDWGECIESIADNSSRCGEVSATETFKNKGLLKLGNTGCNDDPEVCECCENKKVCPFSRPLLM